MTLYDITSLISILTPLQLRVKCLVAVGKMLDSLDKLIIHEHILPLLQQIPSREPGVLMAVLGTYTYILCTCIIITYSGRTWYIYVHTYYIQWNPSIITLFQQRPFPLHLIH